MGAMYNTSDKIVKNLSYIESASVSFNIPDTITITVVDATPSYVIPNGNGYLLVSSKGRILEEISENKDKLPALTCGDIKTTEVGQYVSFSDANVPDILEDVSQSLINNKVKNITGFDVTDTANIKLVYDGRIDINIGLPDDIDYKIRTAMTIINEKLDPNNTGLVAGTLDVSACSTSKISHYKPAATQPTAATQATTQATTQAADSSADTGDGYTGNYTWMAEHIRAVTRVITTITAIITMITVPMTTAMQTAPIRASNFQQNFPYNFAEKRLKSIAILKKYDSIR